MMVGWMKYRVSFFIFFFVLKTILLCTQKLSKKVKNTWSLIFMLFGNKHCKSNGHYVSLWWICFFPKCSEMLEHASTLSRSQQYQDGQTGWGCNIDHCWPLLTIATIVQVPEREKFGKRCSPHFSFKTLGLREVWSSKKRRCLETMTYLY